MLKRFTTLSPQKNMLFLSFLLPLFVMMVIYATMGVYPFGNSTLLTVDLGQQYVDFFSYYRTTLLSDPSALFFSFTKSFGGEMLGLWAYYLMSPFNLIFLLFPQSQLPLAVTILIDPDEGFGFRTDFCSSVDFPVRRQRLVGAVLRSELCPDGLRHRQSIERHVAGRACFPASDHSGFRETAIR